MGLEGINSYSRNYAILTSDRLILNAREDSIIMSSKKTIGFSAAEQVHINVGPLGKRDPSKHFLIINTPRLQIGLQKDAVGVERIEPVAKSDSLIALLDSLTTAMTSFATVLEKAVATGTGVSSLTEINLAAKALKESVRTIRNKYLVEDSPLKSKITTTL